MRLGPSAGQVRAGGSFGLSGIWGEGAELSRLSGIGLFRHYAWQAMQGVASSPVTVGLTVLTIAMTLALLAAVLLFAENAGMQISASSTDLTMSVFLRDGVSDPDREALQRELSAQPGVARVRYQSKKEALELFRKDLGDQSALVAGLDADNPLPASLEVSMQPGAIALFRPLAERYRRHALVEQLEFNETMLGQLGSLLEAARAGGIMMVLVVLIMSIFIIASTIKLALFSHRDEIEIMRLVGATDRFVHTPYMLEGAAQGAVGSILALGLVFGVFSFVRGAALTSPVLGLLVKDLRFLSVGAMVLVLSMGALVGLVGSFLTLRRFRVE